MHRPFAIPEPDEGEAHWQVIAKKAKRGGAELELYAATAADGGCLSGWQPIASAMVESTAALSAAPQLPDIDCDPVSSDAVYERYKSLGAEFGPTFRCLRDIERQKGFARALVKIPDNLEHTIYSHAIHPVLIDAALQLCAIAACSGSGPLLPDNLFLPVGADRVVIYPGPHRQLSAHVRAREKTAITLNTDVWLETLDGRPVLVIEGMRFARGEPRAAEASVSDGMLYEIAWQRASAPRPSGPSSVAGSWLLFADSGGTADALAAHIQAAGGSCYRVLVGDAFERIVGAVLGPQSSRARTLSSTAGARRMEQRQGAQRGRTLLESLRRNDEGKDAGVTWSRECFASGAGACQDGVRGWLAVACDSRRPSDRRLRKGGWTSATRRQFVGARKRNCDRTAGIGSARNRPRSGYRKRRRNRPL